jgi:hypothetical protein
MRYTFDSPAQARHHVHFAIGRHLLFFPDPSPDVSGGQRVVIELCFEASDQSLSVRGEVHSVETGGLRGAWIEVFSLGLLDGLRIVESAPRRIFQRLPTLLRVRTQRPGRGPAMAGLADVSASGARIVATGVPWKPGDEIGISDLAGGPSLRGDVVWSRDDEVAIRFRRGEATTRRNAVRLVASANERWREAREARHPGACGCGRGGALFEPLLPKPAQQRARG